MPRAKAMRFLLRQLRAQRGELAYCTGIPSRVNGLVFPSRDTESLKLAVENVLKNLAKRSEVGAAGRRKCEANYQISDLARRWVALWCGHKNSSKPS
jgi:glycosyltransferase involved in cell wall biosynthesis